MKTGKYDERKEKEGCGFGLQVRKIGNKIKKTVERILLAPFCMHKFCIVPSLDSIVVVMFVCFFFGENRKREREKERERKKEKVEEKRLWIFPLLFMCW